MPIFMDEHFPSTYF